jgi:DNA-binding SARP family transcriptional activator
MLRLRTLGESTIEIDGVRIGPESSMLFGILIYLAIERGRPTSRARLKEMFWPDVSEANARHSLRQLVYRIRGLGLPLMATTSDISLSATLVEADFDVFTSPTERSRADELDNRQANLTAVDVFLQGYAPTFSETFRVWLDQRRSIVHADMRRALLSGLARNRTSGQWSTVEALARKTLYLDPLNEEATLALAEATALAGNKLEAVEMLDRYIAEIGERSPRRLDLPPSLLRRRIAERVDPRVLRLSDAPFIGRAESMAVLHGVLRTTLTGHGGNCCVWGPAGIGKTRLLEEFSRSAILQGVRVERALCRAPDRQRPMSVFTDLVPKLLKLPGALGCSPETLQLLGRLSYPDRGALKLSPESSESEILAASIRRALLDLLDAISAETPLIIIVDDIHWADPRSVAVLAEAIAWTVDRALSFVCSAREAHLLVDDFGFSSHKLSPLSTSETRELIDALLKEGTVYPHAAAETLIQVACGNPFYVRELVSYWQETGDCNSAPPSLSALLTHRIESLDSRALLTLQSIAVLERNASIDNVRSVLGSANLEVLLAIGTLESGGLIVETQGRLACMHDMVARAAVAHLSPIARRCLHQLTAIALEGSAADCGTPAIMWECSRHWGLAGRPDRAIRFALDCARHLLELGLPHEAAELLRSVTPLAMTSELGDQVSSVLCVALHRAVRWNELLILLRDKKARMSLRMHDDEELMLIDAEYRVGAGDPHLLMSRTVVCASAPDATPEHRLGAACQGLIVADGRCDDVSAREIFRAVQDLMHVDGDLRCLRIETMMLYHTTFDDLDLAVAAARELVGAQTTDVTPSEIARRLRFAGFPIRASGRLDEAQDLALRALALSQRYRLDYSTYAATIQLANIQLAANNPEESLRWYHASLELEVSAIDPLVAFERSLIGVRLHLTLGNLEEAFRLFGPVEHLALSDDFVRPACYARALRMRVALERDPSRIQAQDVERLARLFERTRGRPSQDFCASALVRGLTAIGEPVRAQRVYAEYVSTYRRDRVPLLHDLAKAATSPNWS